MNGTIFLLYINTIASHHAFIKTFAERESMSVVSFSFHQQNVFDGRLMRAYQSVSQYFYILIHHFIKIIIVFLKKLLSRCNTFLSCEEGSNGIHGCSPLGRWYM